LTQMVPIDLILEAFDSLEGSMTAEGMTTLIPRETVAGFEGRAR
jgi:hypothetical protein